MAARSGAEPDEQLVGVVHDRSDGNPFFVVELARLLGGGRRAAKGVPSGVRDVLRRRLGGLPEAAGAILLVAAVVGREFDLDVVAAVSGLDGDAALDAVEAALLSGLVVEDTAVGRFRFGHALVREAIYYEVSGLRRARMHARVAEALAGRPDGVEGLRHTGGGPLRWSAPTRCCRTCWPPPIRRRTPWPTRRPNSTWVTRWSCSGAGRRRPNAPAPSSTCRCAGTCSSPSSTAPSRGQAGGDGPALELAEELRDGPDMMAANRALYEVAVARAEHDGARELAGRMLDVGRRLGDPAAARAGPPGRRPDVVVHG